VTFKQLFKVKLMTPSHVPLKVIQLCLKHFFLRSKIKKLFGVRLNWDTLYITKKVWAFLTVSNL